MSKYIAAFLVLFLVGLVAISWSSPISQTITEHVPCRNCSQSCEITASDPIAGTCCKAPGMACTTKRGSAGLFCDYYMCHPLGDEKEDFLRWLMKRGKESQGKIGRVNDEPKEPSSWRVNDEPKKPSSWRRNYYQPRKDNMPYNY